MSKKLYGFLITILISVPTLCMAAASVQASPALSEPDQTGDSGAAGVFAQEDPANYPGPDPLDGESFDAAADDTSNDLKAPTETGRNPDRPGVIGTIQYPADSHLPDFEVQNTETAVPTSDLAGKIYLWVAFAAALIIFTAAVLGAILLYTRQRYKE